MSKTKIVSSTYVNPVHNRPCPDPYVLKHLNEYWCYCTGFWHDGRCFGILHSRDLIHWRELGGAMERLNEEATCYWAPEVIYDNGRFLMYYSVGNEEFMQIRVAISEHPAGPFTDANRSLTTEQFAIDPHVFRDTDGKWYLFYATDFLEHTHVGTGTVCDEMLDAFTLAGRARPVTRARYDWQVYDPQRAEKGGVRWHTVEGPFVLKRKGRYYQMFSGGNWKNLTYGATYAVSDSVLKEVEWQQLADGERVLPILRTIPGKVIGPGHNSAARGTDLLETYCVYHRWAEDGSDRVLAIDRMDWAGERMFVIGATTTPQPAPNPPTVADYFDRHNEADLGAGWECAGGKWAARGGEAIQEVDEGNAFARCAFQIPYFAAEVSARLLPHTKDKGAFGIELLNREKMALRFSLSPEAGEAAVEWQLSEPPAGDRQRQAFKLPGHFNYHAFHLMRIEVNGFYVQLWLDDVMVGWGGKVEMQPQAFSLWTEDAAAAFAGFALTHGWQDLFTGPYTSPYAYNWEVDPMDETWVIRDQQLLHDNPQKVGSVITKGPLPEEYEFVVGVKLCSEGDGEKCYGFMPALDLKGDEPLLTVGRDGNGWALRCERLERPQAFRLPPDFDPFHYQQFRFRKRGKLLMLQHESNTIGEIEVPESPLRIGLYSSEVVTAFDMIRVTAI